MAKRAPKSNEEEAKESRIEIPLALRKLKGMTAKRAEALVKAGFETPEDLALHFPGRYLDARELVPLRDLRRQLRQPVSVRGISWAVL